MVTRCPDLKLRQTEAREFASMQVLENFFQI